MTNRNEIDIPDVDEPLLQECLTYLDGLRESETAVAAPVLMSAFPQLTKGQARQVVVFWVTTFSTMNREHDRR